MMMSTISKSGDMALDDGKPEWFDIEAMEALAYCRRGRRLIRRYRASFAGALTLYWASLLLHHAWGFVTLVAGIALNIVSVRAIKTIEKHDAEARPEWIASTVEDRKL
jgi:hypothetical protein